MEVSFFGIARHEVTEPMILLLLVVGIFYSMWGDAWDALTIFAVIVLLVLAEVYNEFRAKKAIASLEKITAPRVRLLREGSLTEVASEDVVPGDILVLSAGADIAADARLLTRAGLQADESALTGESFPRDKGKDDEVYAGTAVISGEGLAEVFATGKATKMGQIAASLKHIKPPRTPLQLSMKALVRKLVFVAIFFSVAIPVLGILQGQDFRTMFLTGLSLAFATIPEELPIIITMVLGLGSYTLSRNNFLVKKLKGAETLGNATVIVTDKTGTITESVMKLASLFPPEREREIIGAAAAATSEFVLSSIEAEIRREAAEMGLPAPGALYRQRDVGYERRKTKVAIRETEGAYCLYAIGSPEEIFKLCRGIPEKAGQHLDIEAAHGRRVIAVARKLLPPGLQDAAFGELEDDLEFVGLVGFEDPPRDGVAETVSASSLAGIRTIMVTGDHPATAGSIARQVGIPESRVVTGVEIGGFTDEELRGVVREVSVFARTTPDDKYRVIKALQDNGEVVAVTGDGVNDVLALKGADIGIAMGIKGTDVARDAADAVLADDNYITITRGIFEGRKFFDNLRKGIKYYLSVKAGLVMIFLLPVVLGIPMPFSPIQIIILELFMDLAASAGFVAEPGEKDIYTRKPRDPRENVLSRRVVQDIFVNGFALFSCVMAAYFYARYRQMGLHQTQTFAFSAWIIAHIILAFVSRADREPTFKLGVFTNRIMNVWAVAAVGFLAAGIYLPFLRDRFNLALVQPSQLLGVATASVLIIGSLEMRKYLRSTAGQGAP